jgi:CheY-like chemotaxis protein
MFRVRLPVLAATGAPAAAESRREATGSLAGVRVLVVEDDRDTRELCRLVLEEQGATVEAVASVGEAWSALERAVPDVLVSDIGLPDEDGYSLLRRLRATEHGRSLPAVALTAYAGADNAVRAQDAGFQLHVPKPASPQAIVGAVAVLLGRA